MPFELTQAGEQHTPPVDSVAVGSPKELVFTRLTVTRESRTYQDPKRPFCNEDDPLPQEVRLGHRRNFAESQKGCGFAADSGTNGDDERMVVVTWKGGAFFKST